MDDRLNRALSHRAIVVGAAAVVAVAVVSLVTLLAFFGRGTPEDNVRLAIVRTAATIVLGAGGGIALLLAARRQRSTELDLLQKDRAQRHVEQVAADTRAHEVRVAEATERDAAERRITGLYTRAADQIGSDKAPVRLAGMYALERLAQENPEQRQTIVNVLCAYLRMPYTLPDEPFPTDDAAPEVLATHRDRIQELQVRTTVQRILAKHLSFGEPEFWADIDLDLAGATLVSFNLARCRVRIGQFHAARFVANCAFRSTQFVASANFDRATFTGTAIFDEAEFGHAFFRAATFAEAARFDQARFAAAARFSDAEFDGVAWFPSAEFRGAALFDGCRFAVTAQFELARFADGVRFDRAEFTEGAWFDRAHFEQGDPAEIAEFVESARPPGRPSGEEQIRQESDGTTP